VGGKTKIKGETHRRQSTSFEILAFHFLLAHIFLHSERSSSIDKTDHHIIEKH